MYHASLYTRIDDKRAICRVCQRRCTIRPGEKGFCLTRLNKGGKLFSLTYGRVSTMMVSPVEKKPLYHLSPGSPWLSVGSVGCNFNCPGCQNWEISHAEIDIIRPSTGSGHHSTRPAQKNYQNDRMACHERGTSRMEGKSKVKETGRAKETEYISPQLLIEISMRERVKGISFTYNEPTLWLEYAERSMALAKGAGLLTNFVTNGYMTVEALDLIGQNLDSISVDIKSFSEESYRKITGIYDYTEILEVVMRAKKKWGIHVELITNVIPGVNDNMEELSRLVDWIIMEMGAETPWHITRFFPHYKWDNIPPTPVSTLEGIYTMAKDRGLLFPYLGNVPGHPFTNTFCPSCGELLIDRGGDEIVENRLLDRACPGCGREIIGRF